MKTDYRIGAQILSPDMIKCSFQHTEAVLGTIESIRATAESVHDEYCRKLREKPKEALADTRGFTNAISILGSRGSGKTSIILTLQHILRVGKEEWEKNWPAQDPVRNDPANIMMPILIPQDFSDKQPLLSWIISQLIELAESVLEEIGGKESLCWGAQPFRDWMPKMKKPELFNPLAEAIQNLTNSFELRYRNEYGALIRDDQIYQYMDSVERDSKLIVDMLTLISMLMDYYKQKNQTLTKKEPLLFFVIDDLDMAPQRSNEVLNLLLRYLQHPNVVVLCGWNQELFQNHLSIELLKTQGVLSSGNVNENFGFDDVFMTRQRKRVTAMDSARRLAIDNLKKAFPPAQRFEIRGLSTEQRANFPLLSYAGGNDPKTFFQLIEDTIAQCDLSYREACKKEETNKRDKSFLYYKNRELRVYMRIFDNKSRGMINECKAFDELWKKVHNWNGEELDLTDALNELLNTILFSTTRFAPFRRGIRDLITIKKVTLNKDNPLYDYFCNYKAVESVMHDYAERREQWENVGEIAPEYKLELEFCYFPSVIVDVYLLLDFMENLIRSMVGAAPANHHISQEFSESLNKQYKPLAIDPVDKNPTIQALAAAGISEIPFFPPTWDLRLCVLLLDNYEKHGFSDGQYFFSGTNTLCRMLDAILGLNYGGDEEGKKEGKYNRLELTEYYTEESGEWFDLIHRIPFMLVDSEYNIKRLARYQSCLAQNAYTDYSDLQRAIKPANAYDFDHMASQIVDWGKSVTDKELKNLVFCLRETDKIRRGFANVLTEGTRNKPSEPTQNQKRYMILAEIFKVRFGRIKKNADGWIDTESYMKAVNRFNAASKEELLNVMTFDSDLIRNARDLADTKIEALLNQLRGLLQYAFFQSYQKQDGLTNQYKYLQNAASVIGEYIREWELIDAGWTEEDSNAATELQQVFFRYSMDTPFYLAKRLAEYGPDIAYGNRENYKQALGELKSWISPRMSTFGRDREQIDRAMNVLSRAPEHVRRALIIEDKLYELLIDLGLLIAAGAGERAFEIWETKKKNPHDWHAPVVWSVDGKNLKKVRDWCNRLREAEINKTDAEDQDALRAQNTTKFDLDYML